MCHHHIVEAESVQLNQYWNTVNVNGRNVVEMAIDPPNVNHQFGGGASINLGDVAQVDASRLYYTFAVPVACGYQISLYTRAWDKIDGRNDLANDLWLRLPTGSDIVGETSRGSDYHKMFSPNNNNFAWAQPDHGSRFCKRLPAGQHTIEIAARSYHFQLDRIVAWCKEAPCSFDNAWISKPSGDYNSTVDTSLSCNLSSWDALPDTGTFKPLPGNSLLGQNDLLALHYDIAPDLDDLHAMAAGCTVTSCYNLDPCVVIGAHGETRESDYLQTQNGATRRQHARNVATLAFGAGNFLDTGGISSPDWDQAVNVQAQKWFDAISAGNRVYVAEGGPSDFTRDVLDQLISLGIPQNQLSNSVFVIQHSIWNEDETNNGDLSFVQNNTNYTKIDDGNGSNSTADLNDNSQLGQFRPWAENSDCGPAWTEAMNVLDPNNKLDFSDTVELLHILGIPRSQIATPMDFCNFFD